MENTLQADKQLVELAKQDIKNFKLLYLKYVDHVYKYCYNRIGQDKEKAEDLTSEVFTKAIEHFDKYSWQEKPFVTWLYRISHNLIVDNFKKHQTVSLDAITTPLADEEADNILDTLSNEELTHKVKDCVDQLPENLKEIFILKHSQEYTFKEIADVTGRTEGSIKMQYYRGLEILKKQVTIFVT